MRGQCSTAAAHGSRPERANFETIPFPKHAIWRFRRGRARIASPPCASSSSPTSSPTSPRPQRGRWVRDQVEEVRRRGVDVDVFSFPPGRSEYLPATRRLRSLLRRERFDLVHAHYGLAAWCARLAGARPLIVTFHGTDVRHGIVGPLSRRLAWRVELVAAVSRALFETENGRPGLPPVPGSAVLPCGPDLSRFEPLPRAEARAPARPRPRRPLPLLPRQPGPPGEARTTGPLEVAAACDAELLSGGSIEPEQMPLWLNAANAVLVTSDYEGFGMAAVEALACDVPVLSTPVGIAPYALSGDRRLPLRPLRDQRLGAPPPGPTSTPRTHAPPAPARAASLSAARMAERVIEVYRDVARRTGIRLSRMSAEEAGIESLSAQVEEAERKLRAAADVATAAERRATAEIEALEADLERERAEAEQAREQLRLAHEEELQREREAKERAIAAAEERLGEIEAQTEAAEKRIEAAERRAEAAERSIADEKARAREGAAAWLREQLESIRREAGKR